jgi:hypothetical protein
VIETCQNCKEHHWNTRHDEAKYLDFFNRGMLLSYIQEANQALCQSDLAVVCLYSNFISIKIIIGAGKASLNTYILNAYLLI